MPGTTWLTLHERAVERYGFVTTADAHGAGVNPTYLRLIRPNHLYQNDCITNVCIILIHFSYAHLDYPRFRPSG